MCLRTWPIPLRRRMHSVQTVTRGCSKKTPGRLGKVSSPIASSCMYRKRRGFTTSPAPSPSMVVGFSPNCAMSSSSLPSTGRKLASQNTSSHNHTRSIPDLQKMPRNFDRQAERRTLGFFMTSHKKCSKSHVASRYWNAHARKICRQLADDHSCAFFAQNTSFLGLGTVISTLFAFKKAEHAA